MMAERAPMLRYSVHGAGYPVFGHASDVRIGSTRHSLNYLYPEFRHCIRNDIPDILIRRDYHKILFQSLRCYPQVVLVNL